MTAQIRASQTGQTESIARPLQAAQISFAILLGTFILFGTAIAQIDAAHNAAHDSRHSFAFPCH